MSALNNPENFAGRVAYAAQVIASGRPTSRSFDNCFENYDGDAVAAALYRRAQAKPDGRLAANLWRYLDKASIPETAERLAGKDLTQEAAAMRARCEAEHAEWMARRAREAARQKLRPCRFYFVDDPTYEGFTDGTTWNGFANVWVTAAVRDQIAADIAAEEGAEGCFTGDPETLEQIRALEPDESGLISLANGWAAELED